MEGEISGTARGSRRAGVPGRISGSGQNYLAVVLVQNIRGLSARENIRSQIKLLGSGFGSKYYKNGVQGRISGFGQIILDSRQ